MARFDYYPGGASATYLVDVQSAHLDQMPTRVVVPLTAPSAALPAFRDLTPVLTVEGQALVLLTPLLAAVPRKRLGKPRGNLLAQADEITRALDILQTGF